MKFQLTYEIHFKFILDCKQYSPWLLFVEEGWPQSQFLFSVAAVI
jgi:hypothetical protein